MTSKKFNHPRLPIDEIWLENQPHDVWDNVTCVWCGHQMTVVVPHGVIPSECSKCHKHPLVGPIQGEDGEE